MTYIEIRFFHDECNATSQRFCSTLFKGIEESWKSECEGENKWPEEDKVQVVMGWVENLEQRKWRIQADASEHYR